MSEVTPTRFEYNPQAKCFYYFSPQDGTKHRITKVFIFANGIQDYCIAKLSSKLGDYRPKLIKDVKEEDVVYKPLGDFAWISFDPPLRTNMTSMFLDIESDKENSKELIKAFLKYGMNGHKGKDFEMYGGDDYE